MRDPGLTLMHLSRGHGSQHCSDSRDVRLLRRLENNWYPKARLARAAARTGAPRSAGVAGVALATRYQWYRRRYRCGPGGGRGYITPRIDTVGGGNA
ncbi:unnamed protein product, partial [Iphiclides podalirius]